MNSASKKCPKCGTEKAFAAFARNRCTRDGLQVYCKDCVSGISAEYYRMRRERMGKSVRPKLDVPEGHKYCPGCRLIKPFSEWHKNRRSRDGLVAYCKTCRQQQGRESHLRRAFGISLDEHKALLTQQDGLCAICKSAAAIHTDHDHETNEVRGILCGPCNMGLGQFRDDPRLLGVAASYLRRHRLSKGRALVIDLVPYLGESPIEVSLRKHLA